MPGRLILCGTPIGNLEDMSPRGVRTLEEAHVIACEDTRRTRKLLSHFGISTPELVVYNDATEVRKTKELIDAVGRGRIVVLVSDAGMPGLSDPGFRLVQSCAAKGYQVEVVPGPNAAVTALVVSGLPPGRFVFEGFLPRKSSERKRRLADMAHEPRTLVFYESPHRIEAVLADMAEVFGSERPAALARELTKMYEEVRRGTLAEILESCGETPVRGEVVMVVQGALGEGFKEVDDATLASEARRLMDGGMKRSEALHEVAREMGVPKRRVFDSLLDN